MPAERRGAITGASTSLFSSDSSTTTNFGGSNTGNMAFTFGSTPAPAPGGTPAPSSFSFGAPAPAPGGGGGFSFGGTPAPAPATGAFSFGPTPAPAPSTGGFGFGSTPGPAPSSGLFGTPSGGSLFGSTPAPAPSGSIFGAPSPAAGSSFFGAPAPAPSTSLFGAPAPSTSLFGAPAPSPYGQPPPAQAPPPALAGHMQFSTLPSDQKQAIERLYEAMMQHKRTILHVSTMAPKLLDTPQQADVAAGPQDLPLVSHVQKMTSRVEQLQQQLKTLQQNADYTKDLYETSTSQAFLFAQWPTEAVAARRGVAISKATTTMDKDTQVKLRALLDHQLAQVDSVQRMPSPYLWQTLEDMEQRIHSLKGQMESLNKALECSKQIPPERADVVTILRMQEQAIWTIASSLAAVDMQVKQLRNEYRLVERGTNVIDEADQEERQHQQYLDHKLREQMVKSLPVGAPGSGAPAPGGSLFGSTPGSSSSLFGAPSPAPGAFGFGGGAPAPSSSGLFGSTPAPASSSGLFGSTPTPAPGGGIFGSSPAPAPGGGIFGSTPAPAPAFGAPAPSGGTFSVGGTPAPGVAPALAFGGFASAPTPSGATTPKAKNKSRSTRRR